jgi:hypothetical protein
MKKKIDILKPLKWVILVFDEYKFKRICKKADKKAVKFNQMHLVVKTGEVENKFRKMLNKRFKNSIFLDDRLPNLVIINNESRHFYNHKIPLFHIKWTELKAMAHYETKGTKRKSYI